MRFLVSQRPWPIKWRVIFHPLVLLKTTEQVRNHPLRDVRYICAGVCVCACACIVISVSGTCHTVILPGGGSASLTVIPSIIVFMFLRLDVLSGDHRTLLPPPLMLLPITPPSPLLPAAPCLMSRSPWRHKMTLDFVFVAVNGVIYQKRGKATAERSVKQLLMEPQFRLWTCVSSEGSGTRAVSCGTNSEETGNNLGCATKTWCGAVALLAHRFFPVVTRGFTRKEKSI